MGQSRITYQPALDGLRALAVAAVIAYHLGYPWAQGGFLGVDTFFVLSGFLITSLLLRENADTGGVSLGAFWARRARRLLPALFLMLTVVFIYSAFEVPNIQLDALRGDGIAAIFYYSNWHAIWINHSYFDLFTNPLPLNHLWSLAIEEQFYLLWPLAVIGLLRWGGGRRRVLWIGTVAGIVVSQLAMIAVYSTTDPSRAYYGTESRAHSLLVGCLLALVLSAAPDLPARAGKWLQAAGVIAFAFVLVEFDRGRAQFKYFHGGSLVFAISVAVLIAAVIAPHGLLRRGLSLSPLRYVGRISYGLYLWHWPVIVFMTSARVDVGPNVLNALRLALTFALSAVSYRVLEQPIIHRRWHLRTVRFLLPVGFSVVLASVLIGTAGATSPASTLGRITGAVGRCGAAPAFETREATSELRRLGGIPRTGPPVTSTAGASAGSPGPAPRRLAVFGDSRACSLMTGLEVGAHAVDATVANGTILGCGIVAGAITPKNPMMIRSWALSCQGRVRHIVDSVVRRTRPQVIVWLSGWELADLDAGGHDAIFGTPEHRKLLLDRMEALYRRSRAPGRKLVILTLPEEAKGITYTPPPTSAPNTAILNGIYREFAGRHPADVSVVDFARHVCPVPSPCVATHDRIHPRPIDGIHFSPQGSAWAARWLWPQLVAQWPAAPAVKSAMKPPVPVTGQR